MDTFESYDYVTQENTTGLDVQTNKRKRKFSPFADSPYETAFDIADLSSPKVRKTKTKTPLGKRIFSAILVLIFAIACCIATSILVSNYYQKQLSLMQVAMDERLDVLQAELDAIPSVTHKNDNSTVAQNSTLPFFFLFPFFPIWIP